MNTEQSLEGKILSERLKLARGRLNMSQKTVAKILGVSQKQVSDYEQASRTAPPLDAVVELERLADERLLALEAIHQFSKPGLSKTSRLLCQTIEEVSGKPLFQILEEKGFQIFLKEVLASVLQSTNLVNEKGGTEKQAP